MRTLLAAILFALACCIPAGCQYTPPGPGGPRFDAALRDELLTLESRDLAAHDAAAGVAGARAAQVDSANRERLGQILAERGWPGRSMVGTEATRAAWTIALHADAEPAFQRRCLDLMG